MALDSGWLLVLAVGICLWSWCGYHIDTVGIVSTRLGGIFAFVLVRGMNFLMYGALNVSDSSEISRDKVDAELYLYYTFRLWVLQTLKLYLRFRLTL